MYTKTISKRKRWIIYHLDAMEWLVLFYILWCLNLESRSSRLFCLQNMYSSFWYFLFFVYFLFSLHVWKIASLRIMLIHLFRYFSRLLFASTIHHPWFSIMLQHQLKTISLWLNLIFYFSIYFFVLFPLRHQFCTLHITPTDDYGQSCYVQCASS